MAARTVIRPYKLKPAGETLTRDDLSTWKQVLLGHIRQNEKWLQFLPTSETHSEWKSTDEDDRNGFAETTAALTAALHALFLDPCIRCLPCIIPDREGRGGLQA